MRSILLTIGLLLALPGQGQQLELSGAELVSGDARDLLAAFAEEASGQAITVSAPARWHGLLREQLGRDARATFEDRADSAIVLWLTDRASGAPVGPAPEAPNVEAGSAESASESLKADARSHVQQQAPQIPGAAELLGSKRTLTPDLGAAPGEQTRSAAAAPARDEPKAVAAPAAPLDEAPPASAQPEAKAGAETEAEVVAAAEESESDSAPAAQETARESLQRRLNRGREITDSIAAADLKPRDMLFVTDGLVAVVRPAGTRNRVYWLNDAVDLERAELERERAGRYRVVRRLDLASEAAPAAPQVAVDEDEKARMERLYSGGRSVSRSLSIAALRPDDVLYVGNGVTMVVRRVQVSMKRYWLDGELDLERPELEKTGNRRYRVVRQIR